MAIAAFYASVLTLLYIVLSVRVIFGRVTAKVAVGDGGDTSLLRRMRVHANFAEYVPLALILLGFAESLRTPFFVLHGLGIVLVVGRLLHAYGVSQTNETLVFRQIGMALTFAVLGIAAMTCLLRAAPIAV